MKKAKSVFSRLRGYFLTGVVVTAPLGLTVYLAIIFINFFDNKLRDMIPVQYHFDKELFITFIIKLNSSSPRPGKTPIQKVLSII